MNKHQIRVFISSTFYDLRAAREAAVNIIEEINHTIGEALNFRLEVFRWEATALDSNIISAPAAIFDQIENADLFIGILGSRFGTIAEAKDYGVSNEFEYALNHWSKTNKPHLLLYFKETPELLRTSEEVEQKRKVLEFKSRAKQLGLIRSFSDASNFSSLLREDLTNVVMQHIKQSKEIVYPGNLNETVFVGMSLSGSEFHRVFEGLIVRALRRAAPNYKAISARDLYATSESLTSQLTKLLTETPLAIFDISDLNPNVMIEIGIRSRLAPFILLTRDVESLPFFLRTYHCLVYEPTVAGINNAIPELADLIRRTLAPKNKAFIKENYEVHSVAT
jgi:hypothetical protein